MARAQEAEIDGWHIRLWPPMGERTCYHCEARDPLWGRYAEGFGVSPTEALENMRIRTELDRDELLRSFGV